MIDTHLLRIFTVLARHRSMTVAAKDLGITTSGVSHALKKLEQDLECRLFERNTQNIKLTEAGRRFLPDAEGILRQMTEARRKLEPWIDAQRGQLRIGANSTACQYLLPPILREFRESFPDYTVRVDVVNATTAAEALRAQRIDLALILQPNKATQLQFIPLGQEQVGFLVNPLHPWALRKKVLRMDIQKEHFILPERDSEIYLQIDAYFRHEKIRIQPFIEIGNEEAIKQFVRLNIGIGIFPSWIAKTEILEGSLATLPIGRRRLARTWGILAPKGRTLTFAENVFIGLSRSVVENTISST